jgi:hypothetical protein
MVQGDFHAAIRPKAVGLSGGQFRFVVEAFDDGGRNLPAGRNLAGASLPPQCNTVKLVMVSDDVSGQPRFVSTSQVRLSHRPIGFHRFDGYRYVLLALSTDLGG